VRHNPPFALAARTAIGVCNAAYAVEAAMLQTRQWQALAALAVYCAIPLGLAWYIYDFSSDGIISTFGEAIGALVIPGLITVAIAKRRHTQLPFFVALVFSAFAIVYANWDRLILSLDAQQFKAEMKNATSDNYLDILRRSNTQIGRALSSAMTISQKRSEALAVVLADMDDDQFSESLAPTTLKSAERMGRLTDLAQRKREIVAAADTKFDAIFKTAYEKVETSFADLPLHAKTSALRGYQGSSETVRSLLKEYVQDYAELYDNLIGLYSLLHQHTGRYTIGENGDITFIESNVAANYNRYLAALRQAGTKASEAQRKMVEMQKHSSDLIRLQAEPDNR
jgi:hypothetical protein